MSGRLLLVAGLVAGLLVPAAVVGAQSPSVQATSYDDVATNNSHREDIANLKARGVFDGTECGSNQDSFAQTTP